MEFAINLKACSTRVGLHQLEITIVWFGVENGSLGGYKLVNILESGMAAISSANMKQYWKGDELQSLS